MKEDTRLRGPWHVGKESKRGERTDLQKIFKQMEEGTWNVLSMVKESNAMGNLALHTLKSLEALNTKFRPKRPKELQPEIHLFIGISGAGKTYDLQKIVDKQFPNQADQYTFSPVASGFWNNYSGEPCIIMEEFNGSFLRFSEAKQLLHQGSFNVNVKGTYSQFRGTHFYLTSNDSINDWYPHQKDITPIIRVITTCRVYFKPRTFPFTDTDTFKEFKRDPKDTNGVQLKADIDSFWCKHVHTAPRFIAPEDITMVGHVFRPGRPSPMASPLPTPSSFTTPAPLTPTQEIQEIL